MHQLGVKQGGGEERFDERAKEKERFDERHKVGGRLDKLKCVNRARAPCAAPFAFLKIAAPSATFTTKANAVLLPVMHFMCHLLYYMPGNKSYRFAACNSCGLAILFLYLEACTIHVSCVLQHSIKHSNKKSTHSQNNKTRDSNGGRKLSHAADLSSNSIKPTRDSPDNTPKKLKRLRKGTAVPEPRGQPRPQG